MKKILLLDELAKQFCRICPYCERKVPDYDWFTENGKCKWCDSEIYLKEKKK